MRLSPASSASLGGDDVVCTDAAHHLGRARVKVRARARVRVRARLRLRLRARFSP